MDCNGNKEQQPQIALLSEKLVARGTESKQKSAAKKRGWQCARQRQVQNYGTGSIL